MIPRKIQLGPIAYEVTTDLRRLRQAETEERAFLHGRSDHSSQVIHIDPTSGPDVQRVTLLHEVLHCLLTDLQLDREQEEVVVRVLAAGLTDALDRNPKFREFLVIR